MSRSIVLLTAAAVLLAGIVYRAPSAQATTTVSSAGGVTTINVPIDFTIVGAEQVSDYHRERFADLERLAEEFWWGSAFNEMPYRGCVTFALNLDINLLADTPGALPRLDPPAHQIEWWDDPTVDSLVWANDDSEHGEDSPGSFTGFHYGQFGDLGIGGFVHELGHLMGLGDDYIRVPDDSERGWHAEPTPGREGTLMGPSGGNQVFTTVGNIDQALVDRIGDMLTEAGEKLPECWTGTMHSEATQSGDGFECVSGWEGALEFTVDFTVDHEAVVSGGGRVDLVGTPQCSFELRADLVTFYEFAIHGHRDEGRFNLQLELVDYNPGSDPGGWITGHFVPLKKGTPENQGFVVPITRPGLVEEQVSLRWDIPGSGGEVIDTFELTCESCRESID